MDEDMMDMVALAVFLVVGIAVTWAGTNYYVSWANDRSNGRLKME